VEAAAMVAIGTVYAFLNANTTSLKEVVFVLFSGNALRAYATTMQEIREKQDK
jgi:hypothetical protein